MQVFFVETAAGAHAEIQQLTTWWCQTTREKTKKTANDHNNGWDYKKGDHQRWSALNNKTRESSDDKYIGLSTAVVVPCAVHSGILWSRVSVIKRTQWPPWGNADLWLSSACFINRLYPIWCIPKLYPDNSVTHKSIISKRCPTYQKSHVAFCDELRDLKAIEFPRAVTSTLYPGAMSGKTCCWAMGVALQMVGPQLKLMYLDGFGRWRSWFLGWRMCRGWESPIRWTMLAKPRPWGRWFNSCSGTQRAYWTPLPIEAWVKTHPVNVAQVKRTQCLLRCLAHQTSGSGCSSMATDEGPMNGFMFPDERLGTPWLWLSHGWYRFRSNSGYSWHVPAIVGCCTQYALCNSGFV